MSDAAATPNPKRRLLLRVLGALVGLAVLVVAGFAIHGWWRKTHLPPVVDEFPVKFIDPPAGARAPNTEALGFHVGVDLLPAVQARLTAAGIACHDTGPRAMVATQRENKRLEVERAEQAKARGETVAAVTGASMLWRRSKMETNPQIRLVCDGFKPSFFADRERPIPAESRLLLIFDGPTLPLRHVSLGRTLPKELIAAEFELARADHERRFGAMTKGAKAGEGMPVEQFPPFYSQPWEWSWADATARITVMGLGKKGMQLEEVFEVPWPVRSDAPGGARPAATP